MQYAWEREGGWRERTGAQKIDLLVRGGCRAAAAGHLVHFYESVEIFWPRFVGEVVVLLDVSDKGDPRVAPPPSSRHRYRVEYVDNPCMRGYVFAQWQYLYADTWVDGDILVLTDADVVLHSPVVPEMLFQLPESSYGEGERERGGARIWLPYAQQWQRNRWKTVNEFVSGIPWDESAGNSILTQPLVYLRSTLPDFREYLHKHSPHKECLELNVFSLIFHQEEGTFCFPCLLSSYAALKDPNRHRYASVNVETHTEPVMRYGLHVKWEWHPIFSFLPDAFRFPSESEYAEAVSKALKGGLCRWYGPADFPECSSHSAPPVSERVTTQEDIAALQSGWETPVGFLRHMMKWYFNLQWTPSVSVERLERRVDELRRTALGLDSQTDGEGAVRGAREAGEGVCRECSAVRDGGHQKVEDKAGVRVKKGGGGADETVVMLQ
uniref:Uncharacterized protein n=1 Tax=Chromera velia CCMP2878 TaxID=1169474 RepID=A0A0G4HQM1_9ALVE|eukprot:Cvel_30222.t1-p1 / transcript=Cvel_30222.t1 / gene=Cvel_30222 / organism=Chromera_velia_CCMP2878 / gene_product=hypothetical protein / transcript_product=hypothetical protein / location=Cvel_scaffold4281:127-1437(+) / protein_length=437 / sequence_SO=supercontig / SO=protein_coding / is_pseudo=false